MSTHTVVVRHPAPALRPVWAPFPLEGLVRPLGRQAGFSPVVDATREGDDVVVRVELPDVDVARDVTVELDRGSLVIAGERRDERVADGALVRESRYGSFRRSFALPEGVTAEQVEASYDAGVLTVRVRSAVPTPPVAVQVPITVGAPGLPAVESAASAQELALEQGEA